MQFRLDITPISERITLKDHVYERLKDAIMAFNIYDDNAQLRLDERELSERLNASRTPVREALTRLEQEGLVKIMPRKGVFIQRKSVGEILEMIIVWAALESMAARLAAERASDDGIASLRALQADFSQAELLTRLDEYSEANIRFHRRIIELSGCNLLLDNADALFIHMRAIRARSMTEGDRANRSITDHADIIEALERREATRVSQLVYEHTMKLYNHVELNWREPALRHSNRQSASPKPDTASATLLQD